MSETRAGFCTWTINRNIESWETECGDRFHFNHDGPTENGWNFCPYCGRDIDVEDTDE